MGALATDPRESDAKKQKFLKNGTTACTEIFKYRLYHEDMPVGTVVECHPMEAEAWNRNAKAYFRHQCTLGRKNLPLLIWQKETAADSPVYRVPIKENGKKKHVIVCAGSKAAAKREAAKLVNIAATIGEPEQDEDLVAELYEARESQLSEASVRRNSKMSGEGTDSAPSDVRG